MSTVSQITVTDVSQISVVTAGTQGVAGPNTILGRSVADSTTSTAGSLLVYDHSNTQWVDSQSSAAQSLNAKLFNLGFTSGGAVVTGVLDEDNMGSNSNTKLATQQSIKSYVDAQNAAQAVSFQGDTGGNQSVTINTEVLNIAGGTGLDTVGSSNTLTINIDSTVATLTGSQTLTNKTLTSPVLNSVDLNGGDISSDTVINKSPLITLAGDLSGSATLSLLGNATLTATIVANSVALGTDTTGNYVATLAASNAGIDVANSGAETAGVTVGLNTEYVQDLVGAMVSSNTENGITVTYQDADGTIDFDVADPVITLSGDVAGSATMTNLGDVTISTTIQANSVALGTDTTGNYIATVAAGEGIDVSGSGSESAGITISAEDATDSNKGIASFDSTDFSVSSGAVTLQAERVQDIVGAMVSSNTESGIAVAYQDADGTLDFNADDFTIALSGDLSGSVTITDLASATLTATIVNNAVALGTDTTGNYVATITAGEGIDVSGSGSETAGVTITAEDATDSNKGIASFDSTDFTVSSGDVTLNSERVQDIVGAMVSSNTESGIAVTYEDGDGTLDFNVADPTITIAGDVDGSATMTNLGNTTITVALDTVNSNVGSFGTATAIPAITVNAKGLVTAVSTNAIATNFTLAADSGSNDTFNTGETLTFSGTSNEVTTAVSNNEITIGLPDDVTIGGALTVTGNFTVNGTTTTLNTATLDVEDLTIRVGKNATTLSATNGAGIEFGASSGKPTITWDNSNSRLTSNKTFHAASLIGALTGNASTATTLETARAIALSGDVVGTANFDGSAGISISTTIQANSVALGTDTTGNYIATITGTSNEVEVSGSGSETAAVTIGLPSATEITTSLGVGGGSTNGIVIEQGAIKIKNGGTQSFIDFYCESNNAHYLRLQAPAHSAFSGNPTVTLPATAGTLVGSGDSGTVSNTMLAGSIANSKLANSTITVSDGSNSTATALGGTITFAAGEGLDVAESSGTVTISAEDATSSNKGVASFDSTDFTVSSGAVTLNAERIQDLTGAMFSSNTETGITATYQDSDGTIDLVLASAQSTVTSLGTLTALTVDGDVTFTGAATNIVFDKSDNALEFADNSKAVFGAGSDLQIYHDGSNSYINDSGTGNLRIGGTEIDILNPDSNEFKARFKTDGAVELYHDNSKKFETTSAGATVTGTLAATLSTAAQANVTSLGTLTGLTVNGDVTLTGASADIVFDQSDNALEFATNAKAVFGDSLTISRIGNSSYIHETGSGDLYIKGSDIYITDADNNQFIHLDDDGTGGTVRLKHEGSTKFTTTSTGATITGVLVSDGLTIGSAVITEAELEILDGATVTTAELNLLDGGTSATSTTLASADRVIVNDAGTMKQVALSDLATFMGDNVVINQTQTALTISGNASVGGTFTVTGATTLNGGLTMDTDKFVVANTTGNTSIGGTLGVTGLSTLASLAVTNDVTVNTNVFKVDTSNNRVGVKTASPSVSLDVGSATDAMIVPKGTTAQRPSGAAGQFRFNTSLNRFEGHDGTSFGEIGGGGSNTFTVDNFTTANSSTTAFTLSQTPESEDNLIVFVGGVFQNPNDYVLNGTTLTLDEAPPSATRIIVYSVRAAVSGSNLNNDQFTCNGSTTAFTLSIAPVDENNTQVFLDGVYQQKTDYSVSGTTLTMDTAPANGAILEVNTFTQTDINVPVNDTIKASHLNTDIISGLTEVTAVSGDKLMILDATDSALKKTDVNTLMATAVSISSSADAVALTFDSNENATFAGNVTVAGNVDATGAFVDSAENRGIKFDSTSVKPSNGSGGDADDHIDLGTSSARFKNLHLSGTVTATALNISQGTPLITLTDTSSSATTTITLDGVNTTIDSNGTDGDIIFKGNDGGSEITALTLDMSASGAATFNDQITLGGNLIHAGNFTIDSGGDITLDADGADIKLSDGGTEFGRFTKNGNDFELRSIVTNGDFKIIGERTAGTVNALSIDMSDGGAATFSSHIQTNFLKLENAQISQTSGDLTLDVAGDIILDADGGEIFLKDGGTEVGRFLLDDNNHLKLKSIQSDADILFQGNDGGSGITALRLDMSNGGRANFNNDIGLNDDRGVRFGSDDDSVIYNDNSNLYIKNSTSNQDIIFQGNDDGSAITALTLDMSDAGKAFFNSGANFGASVGTPSGDGLVQILGGSSGSGNFSALTLQHHNSTTTNDGASLDFEGRYNSNAWNMARIKTYNRGSNFGAKMDFDIHPSDGNQNPTLATAMTITGAAGDGGQVSINRAADGVSALTVGSTNNTSGQELVSIHHTATSGTVYFMSFMTEQSGVDRGYITYDQTDVAFTQASDISLKENIRDLTGGLDLINQIKPRVFDWKEEGRGSDKVGFIAQEIEEIKPEWVGEKEGIKLLNSYLPNSIPYLIKAIQEQQVIIDDLKARIETLEG